MNLVLCLQIAIQLIRIIKKKKNDDFDVVYTIGINNSLQCL